MNRDRSDVQKPIGEAPSVSVLVFIKEPQPGAVKTRLAASIGANAAAALYLRWATSVLAGIQSFRRTGQVIGYYAGAADAVRNCWDSLVDAWLEQPEGDLGERLEHGFATALVDGPAIAIGTDCLDVDAAVLEEAAIALRTVDSVIGPAEDGGFYLLGLRSDAPNLFRNIEWSTPRAYAQQRQALRAAGLAVHELPVRADIDTLDDWLAARKRRGER